MSTPGSIGAMLRLSGPIGSSRPRTLASSFVNSIRQWKADRALVLLRQENASSDVTVRATLREHFLGETGHERGPAGTVYGLPRGAGRGDRACGSGRAVA